MSRNRTVQVIAVVGASVLAAGCSAAGADRSGGDLSPAELVFANNDGDLTGAPAVARFVEMVEELSSGRLTVRVESDYGGEDRVIEGVAAGDADLGWSGTRGFDTVGIDAFQPLHAPFLITSYAAQAAVVQDLLAEELLGSLEPLGLTGLGLAADQLRMPAAVETPLLTPDHFAGLVMRTFPSEIQAEGIEALGAEPTTEGHPADGDGVEAIETMWWTYQEQHQAGYVPFVTHNAVLWPRTIAVFANSEALAALDDEARGWVEQAAAEAAEWSVEHAADEVDAHIESACTDGARIATATPDQLAELRSAVEPVYEAMRADEAQADTLQRIETLVAGATAEAPPQLPDGCAYQPGDENRPQQVEPPTAPGDSGDLPQGVYRYVLTEQQLLDAGAPPRDAQMNAGVFTWTLTDGEWRYEQAPTDQDAAESTGSACAGWYDVQDDVVIFATSTEIAGGDCAPPSWDARWSAEGDVLAWSDVSIPDFGFVFAPRGWERIG